MSAVDRDVRLATGTLASLRTVAGILYLLESLLAGDPQDRTLVVHLRAACLTDGPVHPELRKEFDDCGLLVPGGAVEPVVREVVRAAVRGEGDHLFLVSPYTARRDRSVSDLLISLDKVRVFLSQEEVDALARDWTAPSTQQPKVGPAEKPASWLDYVRRRYHSDDGLPPPLAN